jgi:hypothetical protein
LVGGKTYTTTANKTGKYSFTIPDDLKEGGNLFTITATDAAGNISPALTKTITVDTTGPSMFNITSTLFKKDPKGNLVPVVNTVPWPSTNVPPSIIFNQAADSYNLSVSELAFFTIKNKLDKVVYQKADQLTKELLLSPRFLISGLYNLESKDALGNISKNTFSVVNNIGSTKLSAVNNLKFAMSAMKTKNLEITLSSDNIIFNQSTTTSKITSSELALFLIKDSFGKIIYQSPQLQTELFLYPRFFQTGDYILESTTATGQTSVNKFSVTKM